MIIKKGKLFIISTPIGNMEDITIRAIKTLKEDIDILFCEDTRRTRKLLSFYEISLPARSLHSHSSDKKLRGTVDLILSGKNVAYATDSGTPCISDPGSRLVKAAQENDITVVPIPGASALTAIVSVSGFHGKNIVFSGFLSKKEGKRKKELEQLKNCMGIAVIYESPYRIKRLIRNIYEIMPGSEIVIGREMTKIYEEFIKGKIEDIYLNVDSIKEKGEFTVVILNDPVK